MFQQKTLANLLRFFLWNWQATCRTILMYNKTLLLRFYIENRNNRVKDFLIIKKLKKFGNTKTILYFSIHKHLWY